MTASVPSRPIAVRSAAPPSAGKSQISATSAWNAARALVSSSVSATGTVGARWTVRVTS